MSSKSEARGKVEEEFRELEDRLMKEIKEKLEELKTKVKETSKTVLR